MIFRDGWWEDQLFELSANLSEIAGGRSVSRKRLGVQICLAGLKSINGDVSCRYLRGLDETGDKTEFAGVAKCAATAQDGLNLVVALCRSLKLGSVIP